MRRIDEIFQGWKTRRMQEREAHERWEQENPELWAAWQEAAQESEARRLAAEETERALDSMRAAEVPQRVVDAHAMTLGDSEALRAVATFLDSRKTFLLLLGSAGVGKTVAAVKMLGRGSGLFVRAVELSRLSTFGREDRQRLEAAQSARRLVLDDLGTEMLHDGWRPLLDELVDIRESERRRTVITSNLDMGTLRTRYGARVLDRIRGDGLVAMCGDKSRRGGP